jgi:hypothetical protein
MKLTENLQSASADWAAAINNVAVCAAPLSLLATGMLYMWVFWKGTATTQSQGADGSQS